VTVERRPGDHRCPASGGAGNRIAPRVNQDNNVNYREEGSSPGNDEGWAGGFWPNEDDEGG